MKALLLIDIQNDFLPGGTLAVRNGDEVIPVANRLQTAFELIVATQDWHPANHSSFASNHPGTKPGDVIEIDGIPQVLWPDHCIQGTHGAAFAETLITDRIDTVIRKGIDPSIDSYSGFFDNGHRRATGLEEYLHEKKVTNLYILGLATDYCVRYTALDARSLGFTTFVIIDGCRGVNLTSGDVERAVEEMKKAGALIIESTLPGI